MKIVYGSTGILGIPFSTAIIFLFALFFYYTGTLDKCWYRRLVFPALFIALAAIEWGNSLNIILLIAAAALTYLGFKGYGRKALEEKEGEK